MIAHFVLHSWLGQLIAVYVIGYAACYYAGLRRWHSRGEPAGVQVDAFFLAFAWPLTLLSYLTEWHARVRPASEPKELRRMRARVEQEKLALKHEVEMEGLRTQLEALQTARIEGIPLAGPPQITEHGEVLP